MIRVALGVVACGTLAAGLAWNDINHDIATYSVRQQARAEQVAAYRANGAILRCHPADSGLGRSFATPSTIIVPPPDQRGSDFDLAAIDRVVATQDCAIDTSQQDVWAATHPAAPSLAPAYMPAAYVPASSQGFRADGLRSAGVPPARVRARHPRDGE